MSQNQNLKSLASLEAALGRLHAEMRPFAEGERFWRSWERSRQFTAAAHKAQSYLELAIEALEDPPAASGDSSNRKGWLGRTVKGLATYLSQGAEEGLEGIDAPLPAQPTSNSEGNANAGQALEGNGAVVELPDLIGMIRAQGMTGILKLTLPNEGMQLHFEEGNLVHAFSETAPENLRLGEILVEQGAIDRERLTSLLYCHKSSPKLLGDILVGGGIVEIEKLQSALSYQIQCLFDRLFAYRRQAHFRFESGLPNTTAHRAKVNVLMLLLESARTYDESLVSEDHFGDLTPDPRT